jgi:stage II sporulation protein D
MNKLVLGFSLALLASSCAAPSMVRGPGGLSEVEPKVRVALADGIENARISANDGLTVTAAGMVLLESRGKCAVRVSSKLSQIEVTLEPSGGVAVAEGEVIVVPKGNPVLAFDSVSYAGSIRVIRGSSRGLTVVNTLPLEKYLQGVVPHEMGNPGASGYDALEAQAVAARTYALERIRTHRDDPFDLYAGVRDQVYRGLRGRTDYASGAVRDTRGVVLAAGGELAKTYYCACCGGHTSDIRRVWPKREPADYLSGVPDHDGSNAGAFCGDYKHFRWRYSFTGKELGDMLRSTLPSKLGVDPARVGEIVDVRILDWTPSGRVSAVVIETTKDEYRVTGDEIRWILMADPVRGRILPSVMFNFDKIMQGGRLAFLSIAGGGNGHGVGMCQHGAIAMSRKGYTYRMILGHYYPGCEVLRAYP